jgi:ectoine hydroxylase-related dioxygenase (phytanoyl-CoA dioxygenase family)
MSTMRDRRRAEALVTLAGILEAEGRMDDAVDAYRSAYKLCPELEFGGTIEAESDADAEPLPNPFEGVVWQVPDWLADHWRYHSCADLLTEQGREAMRATFKREGFVVVRDAVKPDEVACALNHFSNFMRAVADVDVNDADSLRQNFGDRAFGIVGKRSAGHSAMNWFLRSRPTVIETFRTLFLPEGDESSRKLITSFDGVGYFRNPESHAEFASTSSPWLHVDAGDDATASYVQGLINLVDCTDPADAGLVLVPRSHLDPVFRVLCPRAVVSPPVYMTTFEPAHERQLMRAFRQDPTALARLAPVRLPLPAGALVVWSSRMLHCNVGCQARAEPRPEQLLRRVVSYVCMMPDPNDAKLTKRRLALFHAGRTTTHQPDSGRWVGDTLPAGAVDSGAVLVDESQLPPGAAALL